MSKVNFFSNSLIFSDPRESEKTVSLGVDRTVPQQVFNVPEHSVGTVNLLVFLDKQLQIPDVDYEDINSYEIRFFQPIDTGLDVYCVLMATQDEKEEEEIKWEEF